MKEFYKILHENQKHYGMQYHLGLNEDVEPFDETPNCWGGIFFADKKHVLDYLTYAQGTKLAIIEIPEGEKIAKVENKFKTHRIIIKEIKDLWTDENFEWLTSYFGISNLFIHACKNGALLFARKLLGKFNIEDWIDIQYCINKAFRLSCVNGHLEVAQWLYSLGGVDIHAYEDEAFRWSCENGHLDVAQWLHSLGGVDIHAVNDYVFEFSPKKIINWLNTL